MTQSLEQIVAEFECKVCGGEGWVCESHPDKPWNGVSSRADACGKGHAPGIPCIACNPCDEYNPPKKTGMKSVYYNKNGTNQ